MWPTSCAAVSGSHSICAEFSVRQSVWPGMLVLVLFLQTGCALRQSWHWEKPGASEQVYEFDLQQCKAKTYAGSSGVVTNETVRRMFACMEGKGWRKVDN